MNKQREPGKNPPLGYLQSPEIVPAAQPVLSLFDPDSLRVVPARGRVLEAAKSTTAPADTNRHPAAAPWKIPVPAALPVFTPGKDGLLSPETSAAAGRRNPVLYPEPLPAHAPVFRDNATVNIQCLEVEQGMSSSSVLSIREDRRGNLWFGTVNGGVSRYDGKSFTHFTRKEGLSSDEIFSVSEDRQGNLWFGATLGGGATRYDGREFFYLAAPEGLNTRVIYVIVQDRLGNLWFATEGSGIYRYDGNNLTHFTTREGLCGNDVFSILEDSRGDLWFGTENGGVCRYDGTAFTHFPGLDGLSDHLVASIFEDSRGNLWFGTVRAGVFRFDGRDLIRFTDKEGLSDNTVLAITEDDLGNLWFGTRKGGLSRYDGSHFVHITEREGLSNNTVLSMEKDSYGNLWIGTEGGGVCRLSPAAFRHYTEKEGLKSNPVRSIAEDRSGNLWLGTHRGDLSKFDGRSFTHYKLKKDSDSWIISVTEDRQGRLWIGTFGDGALRFDPEAPTGTPELMQFDVESGLPVANIELILEDRQGNFWFGTFEGGVARYDGENFTHFTEKEGLADNSVISILEDSRGDIWFGTFGGLSRFDGKSFATFTEKEGLSHNVVRTMLEDSRGNLWFGTEGGGINKFDGKNFTHYTLKEGLAENNIRSILEDEHGNFFFSTMNGLYYVLFGEQPLSDGDTLARAGASSPVRMVEFGKADGLKGMSFLSNSACIDRNGNLWWGTEKGLTVLDPAHLKIPDAPPRIQLNQIVLNQHFVDFHNADATASFNLKTDGATPFYNFPQGLELPYNVNTVAFYYSAIDWSAPHKLQYQVMLEGYDREWNPPAEENRAEYRNLPHGEYIFKARAIGEAGIWSAPLTYRFLIHPPWWQTWWAYAFYALLLVGMLLAVRHVELVRRRRRQQEEIERARLEEKSKQAEKIEAQARELEKSFQELQKKNEEILQARDQLILQEKLASLGHLTAGIAHEIKNPLNFINNFAQGSAELADDLREEIEKLRDRINGDTYREIAEMLDDLKHNAGDIEKNGRKVDRIVRSMMDHARGTDTGWLEVDLNELLDENANLAYHSYRATDPSFAVDIIKDYTASPASIQALPQHIGRVFLNILNNACYAVNQKQKKVKDGYQPEIQLSTCDLGDQVEVRIRDNGPGIPPEISKEIFTPFFTTKPTGEGNSGLGLSISYDIIVKEHLGKLEVESEPGVFTEFRILLPKKAVAAGA